MTIDKRLLAEPSLIDMAKAIVGEVFSTLNCVKIGEITKFDGKKKTAEIRILFKRVLPDETVISYPLLVDCPIFTLQGGGAALKMPIAQGDQCIVLFSDRNIDLWFDQGKEAVPADARCHDLSDGIALVGLNSLASASTDYTDNVELVVPSGKKFAVVGGDSAEILGDQVLALKADVDAINDFLNKFKTAYNAHKHAGNGALPPDSLNEQVPTANGTQKLKGA